MFEKVVLRRSESGRPITAGQLAEALLFYQNVHLIIDLASFSGLIEQLGAGTLLSVLQRAGCSAVYCEESLGTQTEPVGPLSVHKYAAFTLSGSKDTGNFKSREERVAYMLSRHGITGAEARRFAKAFLRLAPVRKLSGDVYVDGGITEAARQDLSDQDYVRRAINAALNLSPGAESLGSLLRFDVLDTPLGIHVFHNIDFESINARRAAAHPAADPLSPALLLNHLLEARADLALASFYGGDFVTSELTSSIVKLRCDDLFRRAQLNTEQRSMFQEVTLPDYPSLREVIDSGQRTFREFLLLLDKSTRFKEWLQTTSVDEGLVRSYMTAMSSHGWIQSTKAKTVRYVITTLLSGDNPITAAAVSAMDALICDKLLSGWRPNHFVEKRLSPFLDAR